LKNLKKTVAHTGLDKKSVWYSGDPKRLHDTIEDWCANPTNESRLIDFCGNSRRPFTADWLVVMNDDNDAKKSKQNNNVKARMEALASFLASATKPPTYGDVCTNEEVFIYRSDKARNTGDESKMVLYGKEFLDADIRSENVYLVSREHYEAKYANKSDEENEEEKNEEEKNEEEKNEEENEENEETEEIVDKAKTADTGKAKTAKAKTADTGKAKTAK
jgi:hypothetical protein